jgi:polysaccharide biosynthesis/export protein
MKWSMKMMLMTRCAAIAVALLIGPSIGRAAEYKIGPLDVLDIAVWNNTAISRTVPVRPDGNISLPLVNDVRAAGLTPMQLRDVLTKRLARYISAPEVSVVVREINSFSVSVIGEVKRAGRYPVNGRLTVLDAIAAAGGFTEFASRSRVTVLRSEGTGTTRIPFNYGKSVAAEQDNFSLRPGDIIVVP